jgi:hypothetical protein
MKEIDQKALPEALSTLKGETNLKIIFLKPCNTFYNAQHELLQDANCCFIFSVI